MAGEPGYRHPRGLSQPPPRLQSSHEPTAQPWVPPCPTRSPRGIAGPRCKAPAGTTHHLAEDAGTVPHGCDPRETPTVQPPPPSPQPRRGLPRSCPGAPHGAGSRGERGGPGFPPEPPPLSAKSGCLPPGGSVGRPTLRPCTLTVPVRVPACAGTPRWHRPALTLLFLSRGAGDSGVRRVPSLSPPRCPVPRAGQGSAAGVWALPITAGPRAGNSAAGPALPHRPGCRGPRGHGAGDPLPTSMALLCYRPKCLLLPQTASGP